MVHSLSIHRKIIKAVLVLLPILTKSFMTNHYHPSSMIGTYNKNIKQKLYHSSINNINEWRERKFDTITEVDNVLANMGNDNNDDINDSFSSTTIPREIFIMSFPCENIILQGETKQLHLNEEEDIEAFETIVKDYNGIFGLGLLLNDSYSPTLLKSIPICEIISYSKLTEFGIFCTIRVVSRASILRMHQTINYSYEQSSSFVKASCIEKFDTCIEKEKYDLANVLASNIENFVETLSRLEEQLGLASSSSTSFHNKRLINEDNSFINIDDDEYDDDNESFKTSFQKAFKNAKDTDCQGYKMRTQSPLFYSKFDKCKRTIQDITAISWAAFCSSSTSDENNINTKRNQNGILHEKEIILTAKMQALGSTTLLGRLHMALMVLRHKKRVLEEELAVIKKKE